MESLQITNFLREFRCLADACEDTCCKGWGMQLDRPMKEKYEREAPELLSAVDSGEAELIMKRDPKTDYCVKFDQGICSIHRDYGTAFLGDACHFYPRISRRLGSELTTMTASLSCPEITRLALFSAPDVAWEQEQTDRLPASLADYQKDGLTSAQAWSVHQAFLAATQADEPVEHTMARIVSVAFSLETLPVASWAEATGFYLRMAAGRLPASEPEAADPFNLLHLLQGLLSAAKPSARPRLETTLREMSEALDVSMDPQSRQLTLGDDSFGRWLEVMAHWNSGPRAACEQPLRRWLQTQLTMMLFPFAGQGASVRERATLMALRFAITRLALQCGAYIHYPAMDQSTVVRIVQSLSRFIDHLADPSLTLQVCRETGWNRESRLRALVGDGLSSPPRADLSAMPVNPHIAG